MIRLSTMMAGLALVWGCGGGDSPSAPTSPEAARRPTAITVSPATAELTAVGATAQLRAEVRDQNSSVMAGVTVIWTTSASSVATVDAAGLVTAQSNGQATITASAGEASGSALVTVPPTFTLSGTVRDGRRNGPMLVGAVVRLENGKQESMTTGPDGRYRFQHVWGTVTVTVTAEPSYLAETVEVAVDADRTVEFALEHTGTPPFPDGSTVAFQTSMRTANILDDSDPTSLWSVTYAGRRERVIDDRRTGGQITVDAYVFYAQYDGPELEFRVNPEFGSVEAAQTEVETYAPAIGRLPAVLLSQALKVDINAGDLSFGGNGRLGRFMIHTGRGERNLRAGLLEEVLLHEAGHVSLDPTHRNAPDWRAAQQADGVFVSDYARRHPDGEDVAESIVAYFAVRYRPERLSEADRAAILAAIPNRLAYFDEQGFDMSPYERR